MEKKGRKKRIVKVFMKSAQAFGGWKGGEIVEK